MKKTFIFLLTLFLMVGCTPKPTADLAATTLPVYEFTVRLCEGTGLTVERLVTESVSCLHDYTLQVRQMQAISGANAVIISGAGLEDFMKDALQNAQTVIDASTGLQLTESGHDHDADHHHGHAHAEDPHIWLAPENAKIMASNICEGLCTLYPGHKVRFQENLLALQADLSALQEYGDIQLQDLSCRELITFHDGFAYFAESFDLHILRSIEEESGSEASASQLIELIGLVQDHHLPAVFTETNGADAAAQIISAETGVKIFALDMVMTGESYFQVMYHNIDTIKEALQ